MGHKANFNTLAILGTTDFIQVKVNLIQINLYITNICVCVCVCADACVCVPIKLFIDPEM